MNINTMHFSIRQKLDRENSFNADDLTPATIDTAIDAASLIELSRRYGIDNVQKESFDSIESRKHDLKTLHVFSPSDEEPGIVPTIGEDYYGTYYYVNLEDTQKKLWVLTGMDVRITKENCGSKLVGVTEVERDDLSKQLRDPFYKPDFKWRRVPVIIAKSGTSTDNGRVYIYTNNDFTVDLLYPSYLHFPTKVFFGGYNTLDGIYLSTDPQVNSDMPEKIHGNIVDTAAGLITSNLQDTELYQLIENIRAKNEF